MSSVWSPLGPNRLTKLANNVLPCGGRIDAIAVSPNFDGAGNAAMYLAMPGGGVWRSSDLTSANPNWKALTDHLPGILDPGRIGLNVVSSVCVDPGNPQTILASSGTSPTALLRSNDGGNHWTLLGQNLFGAAINANRVLVDPAGTFHVAFGAGGYWQSVTGGTTWGNAADPALATAEFQDAVYFVDGNGQLNIYVGVVDRQGNNLSGLWSLANGIWTQMPINLRNMKGQAFSRNVINRITMSVDANAGVVASLSQPEDSQQKVGILNLFKLVNGTWLPQWSSNNDWFSTQGGYVQCVCIAPDGRLYGGGIGLAQSSGVNGFANIEADSNGNRIHLDQHSLLAYQGKIYVANDGGLFRFRPQANKTGVDAWESLNTPSLMNFLSTGAAQHPTDPAVVLVGNQDNGIARRSGAGVWSFSSFSNERERLRFDPDPKNKGKYAYSGDPNNGFYWSQDQGTSFNGFQPTGVPAPDPPPPLAIHPKDSSRIMIGWLNAFETKDRGQHWSRLPSSQSFATALTYTTGKMAYIAANAQLFQSYDDGASWYPDNFNFGSPIVSLCADETNPDAIYAATAWSVFRRPNPQSAWENITGNLGLSISTMALLPKGTADPWLFVGTGAGVFVATSVKGNTTAWVRFGTGLPDSQVTDLEVTTSRSLLLAATWGRGAWSTIIQPVAPHVSIHIQKSNCGVFSVEGSTVSLSAQTFELMPPFAYKWTATVNIVGSDTNSSVKVAAPPLATPATVTVTVTDSNGAVVQDTVKFASIAQATANLIELLCSIRRFPNFPINPLWDPPRDFGVSPLTRPEINALQEMRQRFGRLTDAVLNQFGREGGAPKPVSFPRNEGFEDGKPE